MTQPSTYEEMEAKDTSIIGPEAEPEAGFNATLNDTGQPLTDDQLATTLSQILNDADQYKQRFQAEMLREYTQYNGQIDDSDKSEWQSRLHLPLARQAVDISTARVIDALWSNEDFFDVYPYAKMDDAKVDLAKKLVKWQFWKGNIREGLRTAIKHAFICGFGPLKVTFEQRAVTVTKVGQMGLPETTTEIRKFLRADPILPTDFWVDPTGRNRFMIHRVKRTVADLWALARPQQDPMTGAEIPPVYDPNVVAEVKPSQLDQEAAVKESIIRRDTPYLNTDVAVDVYEYWGDIYDPKNGAVLYRNVVCTFVGKGKTKIIRKPQTNPYRHGQAPFIVISPGLAPGQIYGWGILRANTLISDAIDKAFNVIMDKFLLQVPSVVVYPTELRNQDEVSGDKIKWTPGKVWLGKDPERPPFAAVEGFPPIAQQDLQVLDRLTSFYQMFSGVNEFSTGTPQTDNRKTKEEVQVRTQATAQIFNDAAQHIEENALSPLIKMVYLLTVQFEDQYDDQNLVRMFGDNDEAIQVVQALKMAPPEMRWQQMYLDAEFRVTGITNAITKQDRLARLTGFLQSIAADPTMGMLIDKQRLLRLWVQNYDMPREIVLSMSDAILQGENMASLGMLMQQFGLMPQGGNANNANQKNAAGARNDQEQVTEENPNAQAQQGEAPPPQ